MTENWMLVTITRGGAVHHSENFPSRTACEVARSLALTGMTPDEVAAANRQRQAAHEEREAVWRAAHPPREPTEAERKQWQGTRWASGPYCTIGEDGLLYEHPGSGAGSGGGFVVYNPQPDTIERAYCVPLHPTETP